MEFSYDNLTHLRVLEEATENLLDRTLASTDWDCPIAIFDVAKFLGLDCQIRDLSHFGKDVRSVLVSESGPILVDRKCHRRLMALLVAHEIGHWYFKDISSIPSRWSGGTSWMHHDKKEMKIPALRLSDWKSREQRANYFADAILIPKSRFEKEALTLKVVNAHTFRALAELFDVSLITLKIRLDQLYPEDPSKFRWLPEITVDWPSIKELIRAQKKAREYFVSNRRSSTTIPSLGSAAPIEEIAIDSLPNRLEKLTETDIIWGGLDVLDWNGLKSAAKLKKRDLSKKLIVVCGDLAQAQMIAAVRFIDHVFLCREADDPQKDADQLINRLRPFISAITTTIPAAFQAEIAKLPTAFEIEFGAAGTMGSGGQYSLPINLNCPDSGAAKQYANEAKTRGKKVVLAIGCFDILHHGHLKFLREAKNAGDILIVGVEDDARVRAFKEGTDVGRPRNHLSDRILTLQSLRFVDYVFAISGPIKAHSTRSVDRFYRKLYREVYPDIVALTDGDPLLDVRKKQIEAAGVEPRIVCSLVAGYSTSRQIIRIVEEGAKATRQETMSHEPVLSYDRVIATLNSSPKMLSPGENEERTMDAGLQLGFDF